MHQKHHHKDFTNTTALYHRKNVRHTCLDDSFNKLFPRDLAVTVRVLTMEEVHDTRPVVLHPADILHPPRVKVETTQPLHLHTEYHQLLKTKSRFSTLTKIFLSTRPRLLHAPIF